MQQADVGENEPISHQPNQTRVPCPWVTNQMLYEFCFTRVGQEEDTTQCQKTRGN